MTPAEYVQLKAFARQDGALLALLWVVTFLLYILGVSNSWLGMAALMLMIYTPFFVGERLAKFRDYGLNGLISFRRGYAYTIFVFFYGGVLFIFTFDYLLGTIHTIAFQCRGLQNPLPINITANLTYLLLTIGAVYLLIKKRHRITISLAIILIIAVINKFSFYFLYDILNKYNLIVETVVHADKYFSYTSLFHLFDFSFFIAVFILYRKAMKEVSMAEKL